MSLQIEMNKGLLHVKWFLVLNKVVKLVDFALNRFRV